MSDLELSVVMPTYNRLDRVRRALAALDRQDYARECYEIIVVSDGSTDGTNEYLAALANTGRLRALFQTNRGPAAARNKAISTARGKLIVFIDDDVVPTPQLLAEHVRTHAGTSSDVAVIGPLLTPKDFPLSPWVNWEQDRLLRQYEAMTRGDWEPTARQFYTGNASVRRELLLEVGCFDETFRRAEDVELAYRLSDRGVGFVYRSAAAAVHYAERSYSSWLNAAYTYGRNDAIFARDRKQDWIIPVVRAEFARRKLPLRLFINAFVGQPQLSAVVEFALRAGATLAGGLKAAPFEATAYSVLFGLRYYQGFIDEMGQPDFFSPLAMLRSELKTRGE